MLQYKFIKGLADLTLFLLQSLKMRSISFETQRSMEWIHWKQWFPENSIGVYQGHWALDQDQAIFKVSDEYT